MNNSRKAKRAHDLELNQLRSEAVDLRRSLDELYARFDQVTDQRQVDACIFELNATMAKYDYALKCLKAFEVS